MPMKKTEWTIYHNPRCSKSRQALELLRAQGIEPVVVEYLKTPLRAEELQKISRLLNEPAAQMVRTKEEIFKSLSIDLANATQIFKALAQHPELLERPIVVRDQRAVIARPPEEVRKLF